MTAPKHEHITEGLRRLAVPLGPLVLDPNNTRTHDKRNIRAIKQSLSRFGQRKAIVVRKDGNIVTAGNGTVTAARQLGWKHIAAVVTNDTASSAAAYAIADNRTAELAEWDAEELAVILKDLQGDFDLPDMGFTSKELEKLLDDVGASKPGEEDEIPEPPADPVTKLGDVWTLGDHRLVCGDSTNRAILLIATGEENADLVFTDPPYGVDYDGGHAVAGKRREKLANDGDAEIYRRVLPGIHGVTSDTAAMYLWFSDSKSTAVTANVMAAVTAAGYEIRNTIIWNKNLAQFGAIGAQYKSKHEPCLYCFKRGKAPDWYGPTNEVSVWDVARNQKNEHHPTEKPVALSVRAMRNSSQAGDLVLDPFGGSGSTLIGAEQSGRRCATVELSPAYCDVIIERFEAHTGGKATRGAVD